MTTIHENNAPGERKPEVPTAATTPDAAPAAPPEDAGDRPAPAGDPPPSPPPRGVPAVVRVVTWILAAVIGIALLAAGTAFVLREEQHVEHDGVWWTCGMHPWVMLPDDVPCPICHMDLVPVDPSDFTGTMQIDPTTVQNMGVRIAEARADTVTRTVRTFGTVVVDESRLHDVNTRFAGWIEELHADQTGMAVEQGEPLFTVYSPELYSAQEEYLLALRTARESGRDIGEREMSARTRLRLFGMGDREIGALEERGVALPTVTLMSPASGVVLEKEAVAGMRIEPGMRLYQIADLSRIWVQAAVYEDQLGFVEVGQQATMTLTHLPGRRFEGEVTFISPRLDPQSRQAQLRLEFENSDRTLLPGMFAGVQLVSDLEPGILVPREAVIETGQRRVAIVSLGEGRFEPRDVEVGPETDDGRIQLLAGVEPGEMVVTSGQFLIDSEARMREAFAKMLFGDMAHQQEPVIDEAEAPDVDALPAATAEALAGVLRPVLAISEILASDTTAGLEEHAGPLAEAAGRLRDAPPAGVDPGKVEEFANAAEEFAAQPTDAIDDVRLAWKQVSEPLADVLLATGIPATMERDVLLIRCPMYPPGQTARWLQAAGDVRNPYYGAMMLACFDERARLPKTEVAP